MESYDVKRARRDLYSARQHVCTVVDVPAMSFLVGDGAGDPNTSDDYRAVVSALYVTSYAIRALAVEEVGRKHTVAPLEGLWWAEDLRAFARRDAGEWCWRMMIGQPDWIDADLVARAKERAATKVDASVLDRLLLEELAEGPCVQVLHVGPYDEEGPTIAAMHAFIEDRGLELTGRHHEIYLGDPRRAAPNRLRTILRQPVVRCR
ncbi:GyrI-like domain-containing protein [Nocardioides sp. SYSU DS0663]|uniref:GyrI-like domain-containing protein n=1 Tax=Nocardioides sp. SYSU DS0663 TaxID=3416445 RepID=UPI003F4B5FC3